MSQTLKTDTHAEAQEVAPIRRSIEVDRNVDAAFAYFIDRFSDWWPADRHSVSAMNDGPGAKKVVLEAKPGGRIYEVTNEGHELDWGQVEEIDPGRRLILSWHPGGSPDQATEVEFTFVPTGAKTCRVDLEHRKWERLGPQASGARDSYANGWVHVFDHCLQNGLKAAD